MRTQCCHYWRRWNPVLEPWDIRNYDSLVLLVSIKVPSTISLWRAFVPARHSAVTARQLCSRCWRWRPSAPFTAFLPRVRVHWVCFWDYARKDVFLGFQKLIALVEESVPFYLSICISFHWKCILWTIPKCLILKLRKAGWFYCFYVRKHFKRIVVAESFWLTFISTYLTEHWAGLQLVNQFLM